MSKKYNYVLILLFGLLMSLNSYSQSFGLEWANTSGGIEEEKSSRMVKDSDGNVITVGIFEGTVTFGTTTITSNGLEDIYVHKVDSNGNFLWVQQIGGIHYDMAPGICVTGTNEILISGAFQATVDFNPQTGTHNLTSYGGWDMFVLKLNTNGVFQWVKHIGGTGVVGASCIASNDLGEIIVTGSFRAAVDFDPGVGVSIATPIGMGDMFTLKLNNLGNFLWVNTQGGTGEESISEIALDSLGNIYSVGQFDSTVSFNAGVNTFTSAGYTDAFVQKMSSTGSSVWAKTFGNYSQDAAITVALDGNDNLVCSGFFSDSLDFNTGTGSTFLYGSTRGNAFILKLDLNGGFKWVKHNKAKNRSIVAAIDVDMNDNIYLTGFFDDSTDFDPGVGEHFITSLNMWANAYVQKLDSNGALLWVHPFASAFPIEGKDIIVDSQERIYLLGHYGGTVDFDPGAGVYNLSSSGSSYIDVFMLCFKECASNITTDVITSCGSYTWRNGTTYSSNNNTDSILITNPNGCDSIIYLNLTVVSIDLNITQSRDTLFSVQNGAVYQWIDCNTNTNIIGATSQSFIPAGPGDYKVELMKNGCVDTSNCYAFIPCNVYAEFSKMDNGLGSIDFFNNSTGTYTNINWSFGDGNTESVLNPTHTFLANGTYMVVLSVFDSVASGTCISYYMDTITVSGINNSVTCQAGFSVYYDSINSSVNIVNSAVGNNLTYTWDFGDGSSSTLQYPIHSYTTNGPFNLCLTIDDGNGCTDTYCDSISNQGVWFRTLGFDLNIEGAEPVGIVGVNFSNKINIYPNPVHNQVNIEIINWPTDGVNIIVRDMSGKLVFTQKIDSISNQETIELSTTQWATGAYSIEIGQDDNKVIEKIIVQ